MVTLYILQIAKQLKKTSKFLTYAVDASSIVAHFSFLSTCNIFFICMDGVPRHFCHVKSVPWLTKG